MREHGVHGFDGKILLFRRLLFAIEQIDLTKRIAVDIVQIPGEIADVVIHDAMIEIREDKLDGHFPVQEADHCEDGMLLKALAMIQGAGDAPDDPVRLIQPVIEDIVFKKGELVLGTADAGCHHDGDELFHLRLMRQEKGLHGFFLFLDPGQESFCALRGRGSRRRRVACLLFGDRALPRRGTHLIGCAGLAGAAREKKSCAEKEDGTKGQQFFHLFLLLSGRKSGVPLIGSATACITFGTRNRFHAAVLFLRFWRG